MECANQRLVQLQQWLPAGADDEPQLAVGSPGSGNLAGKSLGVGEFAPAWPVRAEEVGIAEPADGRRAVGLSSSPKIAASESAKHSGATGISPLALEGPVDLLNAVGHHCGRYSLAWSPGQPARLANSSCAEWR